ncbi:3-keto-disaccharide hydrolase [Aquisphaera insulae]|uniref:3-keto-disaccharide hydrolase n=1 Tax=Aquisphaera insulae TaxID=2712864 RepID=UPI0013EB9F06|nr:DUF1080 domain-containing protein [Aquisphaera insulae]
MLTVASLALGFALLIPGQDASADSKALFNGKDLDGWKHVGPGKFVVEDGLLRTEGGMGLLYYEKEKLGDCVIKVVYKTKDRRSNSGLYIRIAEAPAEPWYAVHHGFEVQIADGGHGSRGTGSIYTFAESAAKPAEPGEWNTLEVTLKGTRVTTTLNGQPAADFDSTTLKADAGDKTGPGDPARTPREPSGYIGLQNHDDGSVVTFKEVSVRPLAAK